MSVNQQESIDVWLTVKEIAEEMKVSHDTIIRLIHSEGDKQLEAVQIGTQYRIKRSVLDEWQKRHSNRKK